MIIKKYLPVITALILALTLLLASFSVMAVDEPEAVDPKDVVLDETLDTTSATAEDQYGETLETSYEQGEIRPEEEIQYKAGDIDGDGDIDINDVTTLQSVFVRLAPRTATVEKNGDTNVDGKINIWDATVIQIYLAGVYKKLPVTTDGYYAEIIRP